MKYTWLLAAGLLIGCTSQQAINAQYAGQPLTTVFEDLGAPDSATTLDGGRTEYVWRDSASTEGVNDCFKRIITDGSGTVVSASHSNGRGPC